MRALSIAMLLISTTTINMYRVGDAVSPWLLQQCKTKASDCLIYISHITPVGVTPTEGDACIWVNQNDGSVSERWVPASAGHWPPSCAKP